MPPPTAAPSPLQQAPREEQVSCIDESREGLVSRPSIRQQKFTGIIHRKKVKMTHQNTEVMRRAWTILCGQGPVPGGLLLEEMAVNPQKSEGAGPPR